jgi:heavy metal efflux system protein
MISIPPENSRAFILFLLIAIFSPFQKTLGNPDFSIDKKKYSCTPPDTTKILTLADAVNQAINKNLLVRNAYLHIEADSHKKCSDFALKPTEIYYTRGQKYSTLYDQSIEIVQNLGNPFSWAANKKYTSSLIANSTFEKDITVKKLENQVKSVYYSWLFSLKKLDLIAEHFNLFKESNKIGDLQYAAGSTTALDLISAKTRTAEIENMLISAEFETMQTENQLKQLIVIKDSLVAPPGELPLYSINGSSLPGVRFSDTLIMQAEMNNMLVKKAVVSLEKTKLLPDISVGYFNQEINHVKGFKGWGIGLAIPLWYFPQQGKVKEAEVEQDIALNEYLYTKSKTAADIENLKLLLEKYFALVQFYHASALQQADELEKTATVNFQKENIEHNEYLSLLHTSFLIKMDYLQAVNNYNQTAIQLEFYVE